MLRKPLFAGLRWFTISHRSDASVSWSPRGRKPVADIEHFYRVTGRMRWQLEVKIRAFENMSKLTTVVAGSATLAMAGTIVAEFIAANAGIGYSIRIALFQSDLAKILVALFLIGICTSIYLVLLEWIGWLIKKRFGSI